jgi:predicted permease
MQTQVIITQIIILAVVVLIGAIAAKFRVLTIDSKDMLSKVIFNISLPLMLFTNFFRLEATPRLIANSLIILAISGFVIFFLLLVGWITAKAFRLKGSESAVFKVHAMFGNTIFLGFPLITALYGVEGLLYASMFQLVSTIIMWTIGVIILNQGNGTSWKKSLRKVLNPNTIATVTGLICFILSVRLPDILLKPMTELGSANTWLSMLYIGAMLVLSNVGGLLKKKNLYLVSFNRLILGPALLIVIFYLIGLTGLAPEKLVTSVIILEASMPCMVTVVIMAKEFGSDDRLATGNVFVSTILSILTLPLVVMVLEKLL